MSERVVKIHATIVTELTDDEVIEMGKRWRDAEDGGGDSVRTVDDAAGELFEFGVIYGQGLGRPSLAVAEVIESGWSWA